MNTTELDLGIEVLDAEDTVVISRFVPSIRWLHWFNAFMILSLYTLGILQIVELKNIDHFFIQDTRQWHAYAGMMWCIGVCLLILLNIKNKIQSKNSVSPDKVIIKQKIFLVLSSGFMAFMAIAGLILYWLRAYDLPALKSTILFLHGLVALLYLPALFFHIYLGVLNKNTRQSLRTMIKDVRLEYIIHNSVPQLLAYLNTTQGPFFIQGQINFISILSFQVKIPHGLWEQWVEVPQFKQVQLVHPDLKIPVILPIRLQSVISTVEFVIPTFEFDLSPQESAKQILSRSIFFQKLFLENRLTPRFSCHLQVNIQCGSQQIEGEIVDVSRGGLGILMPSKVKKGEMLYTEIQISPMTEKLSLGGTIIVTKKIVSDLWMYGVTFKKMSPEDKIRLDEVLKVISLNPLIANQLKS